MKRFVIALLHSAALLLGLILPAYAECLPEVPVPDAATIQRLVDQSVDRGFLWKISKDGQASWLYGTIHANQLDGMLPGPKTRQALHNSDVIALELDLSDAATLAEAARLGQRGAGNIPKQFLPRIEAQLAKACLPADLLKQQHPALLLNSVMLMDARNAGIEPTYGSEILLLGYAQAAKKKIISLESAAEQMAAILGPDDKMSAAYYETALQLIESGQARAQLVKTVDIWNRADLAEMENYPQWCQCLNTPDDRVAMKRINDDRNVVMAQRIAKQYRKGQTMFIAVGSLHMIGKTGLPSLLKKQGFSVEQVF